MSYLGETPPPGGFLYAPGHIDGLILSNNGVDPSNDIDISDGSCQASNNFIGINLDGSLTKQIDVNWAEGNNAGGFPSGLTLTSDTWYHVFVIKDVNANKVDVGFDTSLTATNLLSDASGYTAYRRIGSVLYETSAIRPFFQDGDEFFWDTPIQDSRSAPTSRSLQTLLVPSGVEVLAKIYWRIVSGASTISYGYILNPKQSDFAPSLSLFTTDSGAGGSGDADSGSDTAFVYTNTSSQIAERWSVGNTRTITTIGWIDKRGRR